MSTQSHSGGGRFDAVIASAVPTRVLIAAFSGYLFLVGLTWVDEATRYIFGVERLDIRSAFMACGIGVVYALWDDLRLGLAWVCLVGLACVGRFFTVILDGGVLFDEFYEQVRAFGWVFLWLFTIACVVQVAAARVLRGGKWSG